MLVNVKCKRIRDKNELVKNVSHQVAYNLNNQTLIYTNLLWHCSIQNNKQVVVVITNVVCKQEMTKIQLQR